MKTVRHVISMFDLVNIRSHQSEEDFVIEELKHVGFKFDDDAAPLTPITSDYDVMKMVRRYSQEVED